MHRLASHRRLSAAFSACVLPPHVSDEQELHHGGSVVSSPGTVAVLPPSGGVRALRRQRVIQLLLQPNDAPAPHLRTETD